MFFPFSTKRICFIWKCPGIFHINSILICLCRFQSTASTLYSKSIIPFFQPGSLWKAFVICHLSTQFILQILCIAADTFCCFDFSLGGSDLPLHLTLFLRGFIISIGLSTDCPLIRSLFHILFLWQNLDMNYSTIFLKFVMTKSMTKKCIYLTNTI